MKLASLFVGCLGLMVVACGGGGSGGSGDGGGGGGGESCDDVCDALFAQSCFYGGGEADCRTSCNGWDAMYATGVDYCQTAWGDYRSCVTSAALVCTDDFDPDWNAMPCRQHWDHVQNYCVSMSAMPSTPCTVNAAFDAFCTATPGTPQGRVCPGDAPADCVVGGNDNNADLYCCPAS